MQLRRLQFFVRLHDHVVVVVISRRDGARRRDRGRHRRRCHLRGGGGCLIGLRAHQAVGDERGRRRRRIRRPDERVRIDDCRLRRRRPRQIQKVRVRIRQSEVRLRGGGGREALDMHRRRIPRDLRHRRQRLLIQRDSRVVDRVERERRRVLRRVRRRVLRLRLRDRLRLLRLRRGGQLDRLGVILLSDLFGERGGIVVGRGRQRLRLRLLVRGGGGSGGDKLGLFFKGHDGRERGVKRSVGSGRGGGRRRRIRWIRSRRGKGGDRRRSGGGSRGGGILT